MKFHPIVPIWIEKYLGNPDRLSMLTSFGESFETLGGNEDHVVAAENTLTFLASELDVILLTLSFDKRIQIIHAIDNLGSPRLRKALAPFGVKGFTSRATPRQLVARVDSPAFCSSLPTSTRI